MPRPIKNCAPLDMSRSAATLNSMLEKFDGCEGDDPGSPGAPSIWLFGVEPGWSRFDKKNTGDHQNPMDEGYPVRRQLEWVFNRNAFKLLAIINGYGVEQYREFAQEHQPFVTGSKGYFKGNLYPYACNNVGEWPADAAEETGLADKNEYRNWCKQYRWRAIKSWVDEYAPKVFIGVGNTFRDEFSMAVLGQGVELEKRTFTVNGHTKNVFCGNTGGLKLVVIPHLSGGRNGLNSHKSLEHTGAIIRELIAS